MFADDTRLVGKIASEEDAVQFQKDLNLIYEWAESNNMQFNNKKFELLRYGQDEELKKSTSYKSSDGSQIEEKTQLRDLGIIMNNEANFNDHVEHIVSKVKQKTGWILRTFMSRKPYVMKLLWKQLVQPHIDYCSQLFPLTRSNLLQIENLQRNYLRKICGTRGSNYWERLKLAQMQSQERRLERYRIIYVWKILEGFVPNCGIETITNERLGRFCKLPPLKKCPTKVSKLRENSFQIKGPQLFNSLPKEIREKTKCSLDDFKTLLDLHLSRIPDEPNIPGTDYTPSGVNLFDAKPTNSLIGQSITNGA